MASRQQRKPAIPFHKLDPSRRNSSSPEYIVRYAIQNGEEGNPDSVLQAVDEYCEKYARSSMHVGKVKGAIVDRIVKECEPLVAVELGAYFGYSAVKLARLLKPGGKLISIELNPEYVTLSKKLVEFAGLLDKVTFINGSSDATIPKLREVYGVQKIDYVFMDHWKGLYKPDLIRLVEAGLLQKGSIIVADNIIFPGAPEYAKYVRSNPKFETTFFESHLDFMPEVKDGIERSIYLG